MNGAAKHRVVVHFMHEGELAAAQDLVDVEEIEGRVLIGDVDEDQLEELRDTGVFVQVVEQPREETRKQSFAPPPPPDAELSAVGPLPQLPKPLEAAEEDYYVMEMSEPLLASRAERLAELDATLLEKLDSKTYRVSLHRQRVGEVADLPYVTHLRLYTPTDTVDPVLLSARTGDPQVTLEVLLHRPEDLDQVKMWLDDHGVEVLSAGSRKIRLTATAGTAVLKELARLREIALLEEFVPPTFENDRVRAILGLAEVLQPGNPTPLTGKGQLIAIADSGIDLKHPDFRKRVTTKALGRPRDPSDPHGHGTHVAGTAAGDGAASGGTFAGVAPEAELFFQSILKADWSLALPDNLADLFQQAYDAGARIHNNSWGAAAQAFYRLNSMEVDEFVAGTGDGTIDPHPDMLLVIAAGNDGSDATGTGFVDGLSVKSPGTAKNALTVGACRSDRQVGGGTSWKAFNPERFPEDPIASEQMAGDKESMAAFSGRGPCKELTRSKPDVVAPGTFILSTRAAGAHTKRFQAEYPQNTRYAFMAGTSMATPAVSGLAALVRQYYIEERDHEPSAALLKATIINGARWLTGKDANHQHAAEPNHHQGFGRVYLPWTIPNPFEPAMELQFDDRWQGPGEGLAREGEKNADRLVFMVSDESWLRLCLAWTDPPGIGLQNSLNLFLERDGSPTKWQGNENRYRHGLFDTWDNGNNVQVIRIEAPKAGTYAVTILASNLLKPPQFYSLVVSGGIRGPLTPF